MLLELIKLFLDLVVDTKSLMEFLGNLSYSHNAFIQNIKKYGNQLSDAALSKEAFIAYDQAIAQEFRNNESVLQAYEKEISAVGAARGPVTQSGNRGSRTSGGSTANITSGSIIPFFRRTGDLRRRQYDDTAVESHIFIQNF